MSRLGTHSMPVYQPWPLAHNSAISLPPDPIKVDVPVGKLVLEVGQVKVVQDHIIEVPTAVLN